MKKVAIVLALLLGNVVSVRVMMWDDTGEGDSIHASSSLGDITEQDNATPIPKGSQPPSTATPSPDPTVSPKILDPSPSIPEFPVFVAVPIIFAVSGTAALFIKRNRRDNTV